MRIKAPLNETGWLNTSKYWLGVFVVVAFGSTLAICTEASPLFVNVAVGKSPATSAFPYSTLFGFVNVAGLMGFNESLRFKGPITDFNITETGLFRSNSAKNTPNGNISILASFSCYENGIYVMQLCGDLIVQKLYYRFKIDANWTAWKEV